MSFRSIIRDVRDSLGSLSRCSLDVRLSESHRGKSHGAVHELLDLPVTIEQSCWANLPPELLHDVLKRLEASESTWPSRKHVVACAAVCRAWRETCKEIVRSPQFCGKLTFPVSLKQPGPRDGTIQCFIRRDKSKLTYHLYLCLSEAVCVANGKFLLSAKKNRRTCCTEYLISMDAENISRSSSTYIGKLRSNLLGTKFRISDTQPPYNIAEVTYELTATGVPRRLMHCLMHSIPVSSLKSGGTVPGLPDSLMPRSLENSFRSTAFSKSSLMDRSTDFSSARFSDITGGSIVGNDEESKDQPLVLCNKAPRWHEELQHWYFEYHGRMVVSSVQNFQLIAATQPPAGATTPLQPAPPDHDKVILEFGKLSENTFMMDYCYPLSAFQAFAICLTSFRSKVVFEGQ